MKILPTLRDAGRWFVEVPIRAAINDWSGLVGTVFGLIGAMCFVMFLGAVL